MGDLSALPLVGSVLVPAAATLTLPTQARSLRRIAMAACAIATLLAAFAAAGSSLPGHSAPTVLAGWMLADRVTAIGVSVYAAIACAAFALVPSRDLTRARTAGLLCTVTGTLLAGVAAGPLVFALGWAVSAAPFIAGPLVAPGVWRPRVALALSIVAVTVGAIAMSGGAPGGARSFAGLAGTASGGGVAFAALMMAIVLRKGIFPAHAWVADVTATGALATALLTNGHLGAVLLARAVIPVFPSLVGQSFVLLSDLALLTAIYAAVRAVAEPQPRRVIALLILSQSACILAGLESGTPEGMAGAFIHLGVVALSTTALFGVLRATEARLGDVAPTRYLGIGQATPRLAVAFAISGLALVGLPGTLGFAAEDLLVHGSLASHPQVGLLLPLATALNAVCLFRLFGRLFLGAAQPPARGVADALPRERWALTAIVLVLVAGGVAPGLVFDWTGLGSSPHGSVAAHE